MATRPALDREAQQRAEEDRQEQVRRAQFLEDQLRRSERQREALQLEVQRRTTSLAPRPDSPPAVRVGPTTELATFAVGMMLFGLAMCARSAKLGGLLIVFGSVLLWIAVSLTSRT